MTEFDEIANQEFERTIPALDRLARLFGMDDYEAGQSPPPIEQYELFDYDYEPILCRLCTENHWTLESPTIFVCEHEPIYGLIRQLDSCRAARVLHHKLIVK